ncbi:MAG: MFS transporter, partial [Actinomycetota bacterium]|nr:MFS transporter [Actinomycetota bacterium]
AVDIAPLREHPQFRRLFAGDTVSFVGTQMTAVAAPVQVYALTRSSFAVGLLGLAALVPLVVFGLLGGAIADAVDRRKLALATSSGLAVLSVALFAQALLSVDRVWVVYLLVGLQAALFAVDSPTRRTFAPRLLPDRQMPAAMALQQIGMGLGMTVGPLVAGALIAAFGLSTAYGVDAATFGAALYAIRRLDAMAPDGGGRRPGLASVLEGLRFLRTRRVLLMTFLVDINAMVFGMPRALFPALAVGTFGGGARTVGLLYAGPAVGALVAAALSGPLTRVRRQGLAVLVSVAAWGASVTLFGLTSTLWLGFLLLALAGGSDAVSAVFRMSILNVATPDEMRGRLNGVFIVVVAGGPRLGDLEAGAAASLVSPAFSVISGGLACLAGVALLASLVPSFARYDAEHPTA